MPGSSAPCWATGALLSSDGPLANLLKDIPQYDPLKPNKGKDDPLKQNEGRCKLSQGPT